MKLTTSTLFLFISLSSFGQIIFPDDYQTKQGFEIGTQISKLSLCSLDSLTFDASDLQGKVTWINYWFVGCGGCKQEEQVLKELSEFFSTNDKVQLISITPSSPEKVKAYFENGDFGFPVYTIDGFKEVKKTFNVRSYPHNQLVVDGKVVEKLLGPLVDDNMKEWMIKRISEEVDKLEE
ncbi:MAG: hypothetical protein CMB80_11375 [Flammeovirgaceae bacterium]|nr:hypothetical protein [Flammeovirgaceae bacterium]MBE60973.1 hypothetical protein [Flammeovirgaceae bacterium]HCX22316.1 hypothetical protein [Cytophagales bacterium]|tara:strand:- start:10350 stop:10886 length:537 start_codon:yes stop_codon:yes gene_type:complete